MDSYRSVLEVHCREVACLGECRTVQRALGQLFREFPLPSSIPFGIRPGSLCAREAPKLQIAFISGNWDYDI